jgi:hypothetical protein
MDPFPPRHIVLATGQPDGAYDTCRLHVSLVLTEARDRLRRLEDPPTP